MSKDVLLVSAVIIVQPATTGVFIDPVPIDADSQIIFIFTGQLAGFAACALGRIDLTLPALSGRAGPPKLGYRIKVPVVRTFTVMNQPSRADRVCPTAGLQEAGES